MNMHHACLPMAGAPSSARPSARLLLLSLLAMVVQLSMQQNPTLPNTGPLLEGPVLQANMGVQVCHTLCSSLETQAWAGRTTALQALERHQRSMY